MGEEEQQKAPEMQMAPTPPSITQLTDEATAAQKKQFSELLPLLGQYAQEQANINGRIAPQLLQQDLDQKKVFGPQLIALAIDAAKQADPSGFKLRETTIERAQRGVESGGGLDADEQRLMTEDFRQGQVNRGFGTGQGDAIDEARFLNGQRFAREQQRMQSALAALTGRGGTTSFINPAGMTPQAGADTGISGSLFGQTPSFMGIGQNNWNQQMAATNFNNDATYDNWYNNQEPESGGFMGGLSGAMSGASAGSALGPWGAVGGAVIGGVAGGLSKKKRA